MDSTITPPRTVSQSSSNSTAFSTSHSSSQTSAQTTDRSEEIRSLQAQLSGLAVHAEALVQQQPRGTYLKLTSETRKIYRSYAVHGSQVRLSDNLEKYLTKNDKELELFDFTYDIEYERNDDTIDPGSGREGEYVPPRNWECGWIGRDPGLPIPPNMPPPSRINAANTFEQQTQLIPSSVASTVKPTISVNPTLRPKLKTVSCMLRTIDISSAKLISNFPIAPADLHLTFPSNLTVPPELLLSLNRILNIYNASANALLHHHTTKYGAEPIFRLGISQYYTCLLENLFESAEEHYLGLAPATRKTLREVYFGQTGTELNLAEKRLLARGLRISTETVEVFWEDLTAKLLGWWSMRRLLMRREVQGGRWWRERDDRARQKRDGMRF